MVYDGEPLRAAPTDSAETMTLEERAAAFNDTYAKWPASHLRVVLEGGKPVLYGRWLIGNDYRNKSRYYGAYPAGYLERVRALFPDLGVLDRVSACEVLHVFSGSLPAGPYARCDISQDAEFDCSVYDLPNLCGEHAWKLIFADPPYSAADAKRYGTPMVDRRKAIAALARVTLPGGFLVWLDTVWPMHRKAQWRTVGRIGLTRSTNHRVRDITIFERQPA